MASHNNKIRGIRSPTKAGTLHGRLPGVGDGDVQQIKITDLAVALGNTPNGVTPEDIPVGANPTATAGPTAVNGSATTFMRSDAAPAVQKASATQFGIVEVDGTTIIAAAGVIAAVLPTAANPTGTAGPTAVNGTSAHFMRADAAPAVQKASATQFGIVEVDNTTITAAAGVITAVLPTAANPTATAGPTAINGTSTNFMRADAAPAVQKASATQFGIVEVDGTTITSVGGVISSTGGSGGTPANPTATAGPTAVNGSASTYMRSDAAPAVQKASSTQFGLVEVDGTTITAASGVISSTLAETSGLWTPVVTAATPGDLSVTYVTQSGTWVRHKGLVFLFMRLSFTPTYTTALGNFEITGCPFFQTINGVAQASFLAGQATKFTYPAGATQPMYQLSPAGLLQIMGQGSGTGNQPFQITGLVSGVSGVVLSFNGIIGQT